MKGENEMEAIKLWESVPGYIEDLESPVLEYYPAENKTGLGTVIIFPGGGYSHRADHEGKGYAEFLNSLGMDAFVMQYRVAPYRFPIPLLDARRAVRYVRANAEKYGIDPERIAVMGSSAGGHLAAITSTYTEPIEGEGVDELDAVDFMPNAQILCYPVTSFNSHNGSYKNLFGENYPEMSDKLNPINSATEKAPPAFIWHTETDKVVKMECTLEYAATLHSLNVRCELHVYPTGGHGLGLAKGNAAISRWADDLSFWLSYMGYSK